MLDDEGQPRTMVAQSLLEDANSRVQYQHEFSLGGFKTLVLINGGAIIALLTYGGNVLHEHAAAKLQLAFMIYVTALASTTLAYVFAYFSQGVIMQITFSRALKMVGMLDLEETTDGKLDAAEKTANRLILAAVISVVVGLGGFIAGSYFAMRALS